MAASVLSIESGLGAGCHGRGARGAAMAGARRLGFERETMNSDPDEGFADGSQGAIKS